MNSDGTGKANLTRNPAVDIAPAFSPDGKMIAFWSNRQDARKVDVWRMSSDGSNPVQLTIEPVAETLPWRPGPPSWQPLP